MKIKLLLCIVTAAVLSCVQARESGTHYAADVLNPYVESGELPGAISILVKGDVQETACVGWADVEKRSP